MIVSQLMTKDVVTVRPDTSLKDVAALLATHGISGMPVVQDGEVLGVISEADIVYKERGPAQQADGVLGKLFSRNDTNKAKVEARTAGEAMTSPPITISPRRRVSEAARIMIEKQVNRLPVVDGGQLVGLVTRADLVRAFNRTDDEIAREIRDEVIVRTFWIATHDVDVTVSDGVVTLYGTVDTRTLAELLPRFVHAVPGVVAVDADIAWRVDDRTREPAVPR
jgi:CBS domain-containing protein